MIMITLSHNGWLVMAIELILIPRGLGMRLSFHYTYICLLDCVDVFTMGLAPKQL